MNIEDAKHSQFLSSVLQAATDVHLDESQAQQLDQVLKNLPAKSGLGELDGALEGHEALAPFRTALRDLRDQGRYGAFFDGTESAENIIGQATTRVFLKDTHSPVDEHHKAGQGTAYSDRMRADYEALRTKSD